MAHGYRIEIWTTARIVQLIWKSFRVRYQRYHVGRLLHALGFSYQKPERRALDRNEERIERWKREQWPRLKEARRLGTHLVFADESGFLLIPSVYKTWTPRGQTPLLYHRQRRDRISVISEISVSPLRRCLGLYYRLHAKNIPHPEVCDFLRHLLRHLHGPVILLWDGAAIHKGEAIRCLCRRFPRRRLYTFPGYAPELNPKEGVRKLAKQALANGRPDDLDEPWRHLRLTLDRTRRSPRRLRGCIQHSDLPPFFADRAFIHAAFNVTSETSTPTSDQASGGASADRRGGHRGSGPRPG